MLPKFTRRKTKRNISYKKKTLTNLRNKKKARKIICNINDNDNLQISAAGIG